MGAMQATTKLEEVRGFGFTRQRNQGLRSVAGYTESVEGERRR
jgi:hypothetical protein